MKGRHHIVIESEKLKYEFDIRRNITVIQGDSATGKTTLVDLLTTHGRYGQQSGVVLQSDVPCIVFAGDPSLWKAAIDTYKDSIIFFDEDYSFVYTKEFAEKIKGTSNYYVLIARQPFYYIPYSIMEIYGIRTSGKYHYPEKIYHEFYRIYKEENKDVSQNTVILVEDSRSGFQFFSSACGDKECISAGGNSRIAEEIERLPRELKTLVIADGAAFGAYVSKVLAVSKRRDDILLYFPESFEWLILKSGVIDIGGIDDILASPEDYIESREFFSWEQYFTELLVTATEGDKIIRYDKSKLMPYYTNGKNRDDILAVLPEEVKKVFSSSGDK